MIGLPLEIKGLGGSRPDDPVLVDLQPRAGVVEVANDHHLVGKIVSSLDELKKLDVNALTPLEAINKLYEWKRRYDDGQE